jgi:hypothetical protein
MGSDRISSSRPSHERLPTRDRAPRTPLQAQAGFQERQDAMSDVARDN